MTIKEYKTFPLKLPNSFNDKIDKAVFFSETPTKHQFILDAIKEKLENDIKKEGK